MSATDTESPEVKPEASIPPGAAGKWVQDAVAEVLGDGGVDDMEEESAARLEQLRADAVRIYQDALRVYQSRLSELPSMQRLRERWKARKIADDDPIMMNMEVLAIADARQQIVLSQVMNLLQAFEQITRIYARQVRLGVTEVAASRKETAAYAENLAKAKASQDALSRAIVDYGRELPELLETMAGVRRLCDATSRKARIELMGIGAVLVVVGVLLGKLFFG
jgi:hypothetical protein